MYKFQNITTKNLWNVYKSGDGISYEKVPNTAEGKEKTRCYIMQNNFGKHKWFLSANTEEDYYLSCYEKEMGFSVWFRIENDNITIETAIKNKRRLNSEKLLRQFAVVVMMAACAIKYDNAVKYC